MFSSDSINLNEKVSTLGSLIVCVQSAMASGSMPNEDAINVMGVILDYATSIKSDENDGASIAITISHPASNNNKDSLTQITQENASIGDRIRHRRKDLDLRQVEIADAVSVSAQAVSLWEKNETVPGSDKVIPLSSALKCDPLWLLTGNNAENQK